jgi:DNA-binding response OmpR family regulator
MDARRTNRDKGLMKRSKRPRGRIRVLIVDDDRPTREVVRALLEDPGFELLEASGGEEALQLAVERPPHIVLLDIMMPGMDGYEVCRRIRRTPKLAGSVVLMLTAKKLPDDRRLGFEAGADDYMTKPFSPLELMSAIRGAMRDGRRPA